MRLYSLAVIYVWTNIYTVNTGLLRKPFISVYQQKLSLNSPLLWYKLSHAYSNERAKKRYSTNKYFTKYTRGKRFFEFSPLAFEKQDFRKTGDKSFRIFDTKRFFQYSPFIARLQRSHALITPKLEGEITPHRPSLYKPVLDHFSGSHRWAPLPHITETKETYPVSEYSSNNNRNQHTGLMSKTNIFGSFRPHERQDSLDNLNEPHNKIIDAIKLNNVKQNAVYTMDEKTHDAKDVSPPEDFESVLPSNEQTWTSGTIPHEHLGNRLGILDDSQYEPNMDNILDKSKDANKLNSKFSLIGKDIPDKSNTFHSFFNENSDMEKPISVDQEDQPFMSAENDNTDYQKGGFGQIHQFGSFKDHETIPSDGPEFGHLMPDVSSAHASGLNSNHGVWGSFVGEKDVPGTAFDAIPVPPLDSTGQVIKSGFFMLNVAPTVGA